MVVLDISYIFPVITTTISGLFFLSVTEQYIRKRKPHQLVWAVSMFLFFITAGAEGVSLFMGRWIPIVYRAYYLFAAIQVSLMGAGLLYLFTVRNVINERNSAKAILVFAPIWLLFSLLFYVKYDHTIMLVVIIPSAILIILAVLYLIINQIDQIYYKGDYIYICENCRNLNSSMEQGCKFCNYSRLKAVHPSSKYTRGFQRAFRGNNFAHLFLGMSIYFFLLMNLYVWTSPLHTGLLQTGKEVSGLPWQINPDNPNEPRALIRLFSPLHTVPGAIALIGGGIYSYITWQLSIKRQTKHFELSKGIYNMYIAFGAWVLGLGATASGFGLGTLYISEVISVSFMYFGFLESDTISKQKILNLFNISWIWSKNKEKYHTL